MFLEGITKEDELNFILDYLCRNNIAVYKILEDLDKNGDTLMYFILLEDYYSVNSNIFNILEDKLENELGIYVCNVEILPKEDEDMYFLLETKDITIDYKDKIKNVI